MFDSPDKLLLGLATGVVFGVLLQKGRVAKFPVIVGQFLLKDWTVAKIMGTAVVVGAAGVYALVATGHADLHVKPLLLGGVLLGGVLFGVGMTVLGYCPGTTVAACGEGRRDAAAGVLGITIVIGLHGAWPARAAAFLGLAQAFALAVTAALAPPLLRSFFMALAVPDGKMHVFTTTRQLADEWTRKYQVDALDVLDRFHEFERAKVA